MATYVELIAKVKLLEAEAEDARKSECAEVVSQMKSNIALYNLTVKDLFPTSEKVKKEKSGNKPPKVAVEKDATYRSADGRVWGGHGRRPQWIIDASMTPEGIAQFKV